MRARPSLAALALAALGFTAAAALPSPKPALARDEPALRAPLVAIFATIPGATTTSLYVAHAGDPAPSAPVTSFVHLPNAVIRGATLPGTATVLAAADTRPGQDASFNASLLRLDARGGVKPLCDRVAHASRPLVTARGRVFVARGAAGPSRGDQEMRIDTLTVDEIDPATGAARTVLSYNGYLTYLAGAVGDDLLVYRVNPTGADLVRVDPDKGVIRPVLPALLPFARDFSVEAKQGSVVFQERDEHKSRTWVVDRVDLATSARTRIASGASPTLSPYALADGRVAYSPEARGLGFIGEARPRAPLGPGVDAVRDAYGSTLAVLHTVAGKLPVAYTFDVASGAAAALPAPEGTRVEIAGFVTGVTTRRAP
jgi:hypothetical protein